MYIGIFILVLSPVYGTNAIMGTIVAQDAGRDIILAYERDVYLLEEYEGPTIFGQFPITVLIDT